MCEKLALGEGRIGSIGRHLLGKLAVQIKPVRENRHDNSGLPYARRLLISGLTLGLTRNHETARKYFEKTGFPEADRASASHSPHSSIFS